MIPLAVFIFWKIIVPAAIAYGISLLFAKKPEEPKVGTQNIKLPTATEGRPFPVLFGCRMIRGLNAVSPFLYRFSHYQSYREETAANFYFGTFHIGVCLCLDGVKQIWWGNRVCWPTKNNADNFASDSETTALIRARRLWGDVFYGGPGGVEGTADILYGDSDQGLNSYLQSKLGSSHPYYRGFVSMVFHGPAPEILFEFFREHILSLGLADLESELSGFFFGTAPLLRPVTILGKRTDQFCDRATMWYSSKAAIGTYNDMNPAHIVYEFLTSPIIGRGISTSLIGDTFTTAADTLYTEGFGLSCVWDYAPDDIDSMVQEVEKIVDGKIYFDNDTEKFEFGLNRDDYTPGDLETFDESDFWIESASYLSPGRMPSKVIVSWEHRQYEGQRIAYDDDIALLTRQGGMPNVEEYDYSNFVCDGNLANIIAARQQYIFSSMPKTFTLRCLRTMSHLNETDIIKISYPALNIASMIVRIMSIDRGSLTNGECVIEIIEDVFGQAYTIYGIPPEPTVEPAEMESNILSENIGITDYVNVIVDYGMYSDDDISLQEYIEVRISGLINVDDDMTVEDYTIVTVV